MVRPHSRNGWPGEYPSSLLEQADTRGVGAAKIESGFHQPRQNVMRRVLKFANQRSERSIFGREIGRPFRPQIQLVRDDYRIQRGPLATGPPRFPGRSAFAHLRSRSPKATCYSRLTKQATRRSGADEFAWTVHPAGFESPRAGWPREPNSILDISTRNSQDF